MNGSNWRLTPPKKFRAPLTSGRLMGVPVMPELNHLPQTGESFVRDGWRFEVIDLDGRRIDKVLVSKAA